jgi:hypothetical protein
VCIGLEEGIIPIAHTQSNGTLHLSSKEKQDIVENGIESSPISQKSFKKLIQKSHLNVNHTCLYQYFTGLNWFEKLQTKIVASPHPDLFTNTDSIMNSDLVSKLDTVINSNPINI